MNPSFFYAKKGTTPEYTYDTDVQAAINRIITDGLIMPDVPKLKFFDAFVKRCKLNNADFYNTRGVFQLYSFNDLSFSDFCMINLKNTTGLLAQNFGATYTVNGWFCNGTNSYVNTNWIPSTGGFATIDSIGVTNIYNDDFPINTSGGEGCQLTSPSRALAILPRYSDTNGAYKSNDNSFRFEGTGLSNKRIRHFGRELNNKYFIANGIKYDFTTNAVLPLIDIPFFLGAINNRGNAVNYSEGTRMGFIAGSALTIAQANQLKTDLNIFYGDIGLPLIP